MRDLKRLLVYLKPHWGKFTLATVAMLGVGLLQSAIGALIVPIFDQALREPNAAGERTPTLFGLQHFIPESGFAAWRSSFEARRTTFLLPPRSGSTRPSSPSARSRAATGSHA